MRFGHGVVLADQPSELNPLDGASLPDRLIGEEKPMLKYVPLITALLLAGCSARGSDVSSTPAAPDVTANTVMKMTEVRDQAALEKLRGNAGLTLQWIGWNNRGIVDVSQRGSVVHLKGVQLQPDGPGRLEIEGDVVNIDAERFIFRGRIAILNTPDAGRNCVKNGDSEFAITQGRKYWRMREFEWCDQLTDYIDIYF